MKKFWAELWQMFYKRKNADFNRARDKYLQECRQFYQRLNEQVEDFDLLNPGA